MHEFQTSTRTTTCILWCRIHFIVYTQDGNSQCTVYYRNDLNTQNWGFPRFWRSSKPCQWVRLCTKAKHSKNKWNLLYLTNSIDGPPFWCLKLNSQINLSHPCLSALCILFSIKCKCVKVIKILS